MNGPFDGVRTAKGAIAAITKRYAICPHCGKDSGKQVDHLYQKIDKGEKVDYSDWGCNECGLPMNVHAEHGELIVTKCTDPRASRTIKTWDVLEVITKDGKRLRLLLDARRWEKQGESGEGERECPQEVEDAKTYWYNESTCPLNWTGGIVRMIEEDNEDPHGAFLFVASVDQDKATYKVADNRISLDGDEELDLQATFPEHFKPQPARKPEDASNELMEVVPKLLTEMLSVGDTAAIVLVKDEHGKPVNYTVRIADGTDITNYKINISPVVAEKFMQQRK